MPMKVVLFTQPECPVCDEAVEVMKPYIQKGEVEVMDVTEGLKHYDLGEPEGVPFMGVISPSTGKVINKIFFRSAPEEGQQRGQADQG
jgi:hypothetical protein